MRLRKLLLPAFIFLAAPIYASAATYYPIIVQLSSTGSVTTVAAALGGTVLDSIPGANTYLLGVSVIPPLQPNPLLGINFIELDKVVAIPQFGYYGVLTTATTTAADWYKAQPELQWINAGLALSYSQGKGVVVADLNSLVDYSHPALKGHLTGGYDFVSAKSSYSGSLNQSSSSFLDQSSSSFLDQSSSTFLDQSTSSFLDQSGATFLSQSSSTFLDGTNPAYAHGTLCAGIIAVMAPGSMIMPLRVFDSYGNADIFSIAKAIYYAAQNGAQVINMSFGMLMASSSIQAAINFASSSKALLVASAGNNNTSAVQYPAAFSPVMAVAATNASDVKAQFSNFGTWIYVDAPGVNIISAYPGGYYAMVSGTSFSAPMVAAEAALLRSLTQTGIKSDVAAGVVNINAQNPNYIGQLGYGRINVLAAVQTAP